MNRWSLTIFPKERKYNRKVTIERISTETLNKLIEMHAGQYDILIEFESEDN